MADLVVELYGTRIGTLAGTWRTFDFVADPGAVETFGLDSLILSVAIPLAAVPTRAGKARRRNFFLELLPEGRMLTRMAQDAGVPTQDVIGLLRHYGRDLAGAVQIWDPDVPGEPKQPRLEPVSDAEAARLLTQVQDNPLGNRRPGGKTSLAGVQDKIVLAWAADRWNRAVDGYPSTHILKPETRDLPAMIYDEEYGSRFARALGLAAFDTRVADFDGVPALIIERYDRAAEAPQGRVHQEDFNLALGASGNEKYQKYGGRVSLARIARVLSELADRDALLNLLRMTVLSVAVGNLDLHAKNISLLHDQHGRVTLAPAYDIVPQAHLPGDGELALAVDHEYRHGAVTREHLLAECGAWGLTGAGDLIDESLSIVHELALTDQPHPSATPGLPQDIARFSANLLAGRRVGET